MRWAADGGLKTAPPERRAAAIGLSSFRLIPPPVGLAWKGTSAMAGAPRKPAERFFIYCRFWPGFKEPLPFADLGGFDDLQLRHELEARIAVNTPQPDVLEARYNAFKEKHIKDVLRQSAMIRPCGGRPVRRRLTEQQLAEPTVAAESGANATASALVDDNSPSEYPSRRPAWPSVEQRRVIDRCRQIGWHDGDAPDNGIREMLPDWGLELWSRKVWLACVEGEAAATAALENASDWCQKLGCMVRKGHRLLEPRFANARLGYSRMNDFPQKQAVRIQLDIDELRTQKEPWPLEELLQQVQVRIDYVCRAVEITVPSRQTGRNVKTGRKKDQKVAARREKVRRLHAEGYRPGEIGPKLRIDMPTIYQDLTWLKRQNPEESDSSH